MHVQVLASVMNQSDHNILERMNIQTDAIIINQCDQTQFEELEYQNRRIRFLSFAERGVGLSRNNALLRSDGDILLFADDDVVYENGYEQKIVQAFQETPDADLMIFTFESLNSERPVPMVEKFHRIHWYNSLRYGAIQFAVRRDAILRAHVTFSLLFGGGARYSCGEDTLFLFDCLKKGLHIYASPIQIGTVSQEDSTWFTGFSEKYFMDRGALICNLFTGPMRYVYAAHFAFRRKSLFADSMKPFDAYRLICKGMHDYLSCR
ncbi:glycosyltransferase family A protein [Anaerotruncus colihominis]|uniref:glycosyltransferase family 2 protein n=1 Tax=Anaerotruncus colihominis TaxID=169435 RepID=UPI000B390C4C|nr:glycosyltransferase family A protein [Anaerotruncus colihominis]OUO68175.1 hypothetical protein B5F55_04730 [Anaerotruncus colihominis]